MSGAIDLPRLISAESAADQVVEGNWRTAATRGSFTPEFIVVHHTASNRFSGDYPCRRLLTQGRGSPNPLPPPVVQTAVTRSGRIGIISTNRSVHAGYGSWKHPHTGARIKGNRWWYGIEVECDGVGEMISAQAFDSIISICVAICNENDWGAERVIGHLECDRARKIDPVFGSGLNGDQWMEKIRRAVAARLSGGGVLPLPKEPGDDMTPRWLAEKEATQFIRELYVTIAERPAEVKGLRHWMFYIAAAMDDDYKANDASQSRTMGVFNVLQEALAREGIIRGLYDEAFAKNQGWIA